MRPARDITAEEENFRTEPMFPGDPARSGIAVIKRDPVEPEPVGTIILRPFRITGYDKDCDGSLMARLEAIDCEGDSTGWTVNCIGIYDESTLVVNDLEELRALFGLNR